MIWQYRTVRLLEEGTLAPGRRYSFREGWMGLSLDAAAVRWFGLLKKRSTWKPCGGLLSNLESLAQKMLKKLQGSTLDEHALELNNPSTAGTQAMLSSSSKHNDSPRDPHPSSLMVRSVPFQATWKELLQLVVYVCRWLPWFCLYRVLLYWQRSRVRREGFVSHELVRSAFGA